MLPVNPTNEATVGIVVKSSPIMFPLLPLLKPMAQVSVVDGDPEDTKTVVKEGNPGRVTFADKSVPVVTSMLRVPVNEHVAR